MRLLIMLCGFLLLLGNGGVVWGASAKALALRQAQGLTAFTPSEAFLAGNFVADEMNPAFIFGPVKAFVASRPCPTTWLLEAGPASKDAVAEYTLYLEEDCPDKVIHYVFIDQSALTPQQWLEWREKFHKSKTEPEYGDTKARLDKACRDGCAVGGELRFIQQNGQLLTKSPEEILRVKYKFTPIYDLKQEKKVSP
jgi:hypothetical protein